VAVAEFEADLARAIADLETARDELMRLVDGLEPGDLEKARRGGWSVRAILLHVIEGERHYAGGIRLLRGHAAAGDMSRRLLRTPKDASLMLQEGREELLRAIEGVDEETFYRLRTLRTQEQEFGQEYSVLSVLENIAMHDGEHTAQVRATLLGR
jgi:uncharacterized damage-inducible protein DinB